MELNEQNQGDYVLVHKSKAKISRARKGLIGFMVVGAIAAISGAGTFASFSASTDNDAAFRTQRLLLGNTVDNGTQCLSTADNGSVTDNEGTCDTLFGELVPDADPTSVVVYLENEGNSEQALQLHTVEATCVDAVDVTPFAAGATTICDNAQIIIRQADPATGLPIAANCVFPAGNAVCNSTNPLTDADFDGVLATSTFDDLATAIGGFDNKLTVDAALPWDDDGANDGGTDTRGTGSDETAFIVSVRLDNHADCTGIEDDGVDDVAATDDAGEDDFVDDATGIGCNNQYMNREAPLTLRWYMDAINA